MRIFLCLAALAVSSPAAAQLEFHGFPCTVDCSGHEAGYEWAEENGVTDSYSCGGNSNSFIEGCEAYADEQEEESYYDEEGDYESGEEGDW